LFSSSLDREELKSAGIVGYVTAASRFDESKGHSFRGYCATRIRGAIMDELRRLSWQPRSARKNHRMIGQTVLKLEAELQRQPTRTEIADELDMDVASFSDMERLSQPASYISLDEVVATGFDDEALPLKEIIADQSASAPSDACNLAETRRDLCVAIGQLPAAQANVIILHYLRNIPFHEIAKMTKVTPSRISQLHHSGLQSLKKHLLTDQALEEA
jgi:RNA polymerase sigma factor for flagellar operon FliA